MQALLPTLSFKKRQVAEYFIANPEQVAFTSLRKTALMARASTSIVMKLLNDLGYDSYDLFKGDFQRWVAERHTYFSGKAEVATKSASTADSLLAKVADNDIENIRRTLRATSESVLQDAARAVLTAKHVYILGLRINSSVAFYLAYQIGFIRENVILVGNTADTLFDTISDINKYDVLIAVSYYPYNSATAAAVRHAASKGATIVAMTDRHSAPIAVKEAKTLYFTVDSSLLFNSITASLFLAQGLVAETLALSGEKGLKRVNERERLLYASGIFEK